MQIYRRGPLVVTCVRSLSRSRSRTRKTHHDGRPHRVIEPRRVSKVRAVDGRLWCVFVLRRVNLPGMEHVQLCPERVERDDRDALIEGGAGFQHFCDPPGLRGRDGRGGLL